MEARLRNVEKTLAVIESNYATKADLHKEIGIQTWKVVSFYSVGVAALLGVMAKGFGWL